MLVQRCTHELGEETKKHCVAHVCIVVCEDKAPCLFRTRCRSLPPRPRPPLSRCPPLRSLFREPLSLRGPQRTRPPPCPLPHTSARMRALSTSNRTCGHARE